jgi:hypothetical protein
MEVQSRGKLETALLRCIKTGRKKDDRIADITKKIEEIEVESTVNAETGLQDNL